MPQSPGTPVTHYTHSAAVLAKVAAAIGLAVVVVVAAILFLGKPEPPDLPATQPGQHILPVRVKRVGDHVTTIRFPPDAQCSNPWVNQFISDFLDVLIADDEVQAYKTYRLMVSEKAHPVSRETFEAAAYKAKLIEIRQIVQVDDPADITFPAAKELQPPVYRVTAFVALRNGKERTADIFVFKEDGNWVTSH